MRTLPARRKDRGPAALAAGPLSVLVLVLRCLLREQRGLQLLQPAQQSVDELG